MVIILACFVGVPAEEVGKTAADMLVTNVIHGGCVDDYAQDQVNIFSTFDFDIRSKPAKQFHLSSMPYFH